MTKLLMNLTVPFVLLAVFAVLAVLEIVEPIAKLYARWYVKTQMKGVRMNKIVIGAVSVLVAVVMSGCSTIQYGPMTIRSLGTDIKLGDLEWAKLGPDGKTVETIVIKDINRNATESTHTVCNTALAIAGALIGSPAGVAGSATGAVIGGGTGELLQTLKDYLLKPATTATPTNSTPAATVPVTQSQGCDCDLTKPLLWPLSNIGDKDAVDAVLKAGSYECGGFPKDIRMVLKRPDGGGWGYKNYIDKGVQLNSDGTFCLKCFPNPDGAGKYHVVSCDKQELPKMTPVKAGQILQYDGTCFATWELR